MNILFQAVCTKCGVDTVNSNHNPLWLCKICAEKREVSIKVGRLSDQFNSRDVLTSNGLLNVGMK